MKETRPLWQALVRLLIAALIIVASVWVSSRYEFRQDQDSQYHIQVIAPNCTQKGYNLYTHRETGETYVDNIVDPIGHDFGEWEDETVPDGVNGWRRSRICHRCTDKDTKLFYPDHSIACVILEGDTTGIDKTREVNMAAQLITPELQLTAHASLKYQGHESLAYDKKNFTLKLYKDSSKSEKLKLTFSHWNPEHKYILRANYIDPSQSRNLVCANIWADAIASRSTVPLPLKNLPNYGAVDGFPVVLYINGQFHGLYSLNLHKDDDLYAMKEGQEHAVVISNHTSSDEAFFRSPATFSESSPWEVEFCGTENDQWVRDKLNDLIAFVMSSSDKEFRDQLKNYMDVDTALDYLLCTYALGLQYNASNNLVLLCYDQDGPWIPTLYGMGTGFGLQEDGEAVLQPDEFLPAYTDGTWNSATNSLLWDRILNNFYPELCQRYFTLRQDILVPDNLIDRVNDHMDQIPDQLYHADAQVFPWPMEIDQRTQITTYIEQRIPILDKIFLVKEGAHS